MLVAAWAEQIFPGLQDARRAAAGGNAAGSALEHPESTWGGFAWFSLGLGAISSSVCSMGSATKLFSFIPHFQLEREHGEARLKYA